MRSSVVLSSDFAQPTLRKKGSAQEFVETRILGCFLKNEEFGLGDRHALGLEQQVGEVFVAAAPSTKGFDVAVDGFHHSEAYLGAAVVEDSVQVIRQHLGQSLKGWQHMSTHGSRGIRSIGYGDHKFPLARTKILHAPGPTIAASGLLSNELQFGSLFAPVGIALSKSPQGQNMRRERDYRDLASVFLH